MAQITTPVKGFTGKVVGVMFQDGVGETADPSLIGYFRRHGYDVKDEAKPKPLSKLSKAELVAFAAERGIELGEASKNAEIVAVIDAALTQSALAELNPDATSSESK